MEHEAIDEVPRQFILLLFVARRARLLAAAALAALLLAAAGASFVWLRAPRQLEARCHFRLEFNGAERGLYPSGLRFTPQEITAVASLRRIYEESGLQSAGVTFEELRKGIYLVESDPNLDRLRREMAVRLAAARTSIERDGIESLYALRKTNLLTREYDIVLVLPNRQAVAADHLKRVVTSVLESWAATTGRQKARIDFAGLTAQELNFDALPAGQPLLALEALRLKTISAKLRAGQLGTFEGAAAIADPQTGLSAKAIESYLTDTVRWSIDPLVGQLLRRRVFNQQTIDALSSQIRFDTEQALFNDGRTEAIHESFAAYARTPAPSSSRPPRTLSVQTAGPQRESTPEQPFPPNEPAVVTQIDSTVLDRIAELTAQSADRSFRQMLATQLLNERTNSVPTRIEIEHYRALLKDLTAGGAMTAPTPADDAAVRAVAARVRDAVAAMDRVAARLGDMRVFSAMLYSVVEPPYVEARTFIPNMRLAAVVVVPFAAFLIFAAILFAAEVLRTVSSGAPPRLPAEAEV